MQEQIIKLQEEFKKIKDKEFNRSLRSGYTSIGYTFETLLGKKEDKLSLPDYNGIEIKTKLGYSKSPMTLFCLGPKCDDFIPNQYLLKYCGYPNKKKGRGFRGDVYANRCNNIGSKFIYKLKIDYEARKIFLYILSYSLEIVNNSIYWDFDILKERLYQKLKCLAVIKGYDYKLNSQKYYKYTNMNVYKLRSFEKFLECLAKGKILVLFSLESNTYNITDIKDHGTAFRIKNEAIDELFEKII